MQVLWNSTRVTLSSINPHKTKINHYWLNLLQTLKYTTPLGESLRSSFPPLGLQKKTLDSTHLRIPLINTRSKKNRTLDSPNILIFFSNTGNKGMNWSTRWIELAHVANNQAVANEGWIARYFPRALRFSQINLRKNQEQRDAISADPKWNFLRQPSPTDD